ncbi:MULTISPECIES: homoserine dehydrogenase [Acidiplasma]|uniref:Homoserine dehydrogenase n=1 Tax=Acidiplasma aeolicum TaxID=507754 RepID=A0A0N8PQ93_9ARCH|nr:MULTISPECIES: homoserine dehydrogenase [Acidiplasma]KJE49934.1 homoserine dehydrogenase [Acidiplasma sp. MBA-1]KPV46485.1 homoserine dehydrogenase [Acidiplasma aeolicum]WMT55123.1 MAG: homoserine dehydrogenase [Acidiplasma sp.]
MKVSIIGLGHIGKAVLGILNENKKLFMERYGKSIEVISVSDSKNTVYDKNGLDLEKVLMYKQRNQLGELAENIKFDEIYSLESDVIVDMSPATKDGIAGMKLYTSAFESGKNIVTSNKAPLALHWKEIMEGAYKNKKRILFESSVGGGTPLFNLNSYCLKSSNILEFKGQVSSTINFVLSQLLAGLDFNDAVKTAQNMGIAETDYHDDTNGLDGARKTVIIANALLNKDYTLNDVEYDGIENLKDINYMKESGKIYRVLSHIKNENEITIESKIFELDRKETLACLDSLSMGYLEKTDNNDDITIFEKHDGPLETAAQVVNDLLII